LRPDLVLTEVALPKLDAIGLLGALAAESIQCAVVVITEHVDDAMETWLRESGARDVLRRDLPIAAISDRLKSVR
jgi:FixJ family two-component response regulator